jgi:glyoxylase-like metal-dependent hydrolase (beta-lactamase superfamily II)
MRITNNVYVLSGSYYCAVDNSAFLGDVYGIHTPDGVILIDCGSPATGPAMLKKTLNYFEVETPISHVIITHGHWDHCGGGKELQDTGVKVVIAEEDASYCINGGMSELESPFSDGQAFTPFTPDITIAGDQTLTINGQLFEFIQIPGHTPGSMALRVKIDGKTILFTGDALQPDGVYLNEVTLGWQGDPAFSRAAIVDSMMKLMRYETDIILPGHGKICLQNGTQVLKHAAQTAFMTMR